MSMPAKAKQFILGSNTALLPPTGYTGWWKANSAASTPTNMFSDAGTTPVTNGGTVYQWSNATGSNHMLQTTAGSRPTYSTSLTLNGYAAVTFDGIDDKLQAASLTSDPYTAVVVGRFRPGDPIGVSGRITGCGQERSLFTNATNYCYYFTDNGGGVINLGVAETTNVAAIIRAQAGVSYHVRLNGANGATAITPHVGSVVGAMTLGARSNTGGTDEEGYCVIYEALYYPYIISADELTTLEAYLQDKFGLW